MVDAVLIVFGLECMKEKGHKRRNSGGESTKVYMSKDRDIFSGNRIYMRL